MERDSLERPVGACEELVGGQFGLVWLGIGFVIADLEGSAEVGDQGLPVERWALRRLASICFWVAMKILNLDEQSQIHRARQVALPKIE